MAFKEDKSIDKDASVVKFHYDGDGDGGGDGDADGDGDILLAFCVIFSLLQRRRTLASWIGRNYCADIWTKEDKLID